MCAHKTSKRKDLCYYKQGCPPVKESPKQKPKTSDLLFFLTLHDYSLQWPHELRVRHDEALKSTWASACPMAHARRITHW